MSGFGLRKTGKLPVIFGDAAPQDYDVSAPVAPVPAAKPANATPTAQTPLDPAELMTALGQLSDKALLQVLRHLPTHQLVRALGRSENASADLSQQSENEIAGPNKRKSKRVKKRLAGKVVFNNKMSVQDCQIHNLNNDGCGISIDSAMGIPKYFSLHILNGDARHECEVAWRKSDMIGVRFID